MLETIHIENLRCLRDIELTLTPLTALVGPNGSGKTAVLDVLVPDLRYSSHDAWRRGEEPIRRSGRFSSGERFDHAVGSGNSRAKGQWSFLKLALRPEVLGSNVQLAQADTLDAIGGNLANVFATLSRKRQEQIAARLRELVPLYADVHVRPQAHGTHRMVFQDRWDESIWYEPHQVSQGTRVLMAFLVLAHCEQAPDIIGVEDPEHALHPYLVGEVIRTLRQLARGELGPKAVQVIWVRLHGDDRNTRNSARLTLRWVHEEGHSGMVKLQHTTNREDPFDGSSIHGDDDGYLEFRSGAREVRGDGGLFAYA